MTPDQIFDAAMSKIPGVPILCEHSVRGGGTCQLFAGHRGYHSMLTYHCDGCGHKYRGYAHRTAPDGEYPQGLKFCFLCVRGLR